MCSSKFNDNEMAQILLGKDLSPFLPHAPFVLSSRRDHGCLLGARRVYLDCDEVLSLVGRSKCSWHSLSWATAGRWPGSGWLAALCSSACAFAMRRLSSSPGGERELSLQRQELCLCFQYFLQSQWKGDSRGVVKQLLQKIQNYSQFAVLRLLRNGL